MKCIYLQMSLQYVVKISVYTSAIYNTNCSHIYSNSLTVDATVVGEHEGIITDVCSCGQ